MNQANWTAIIGVLSVLVAAAGSVWKINASKTVSADKDFITMYNKLMETNNKLIAQNSSLTRQLDEAHTSIKQLTKRIEELEGKLK